MRFDPLMNAISFLGVLPNSTALLCVRSRALLSTTIGLCQHLMLSKKSFKSLLWMNRRYDNCAQYTTYLAKKNTGGETFTPLAKMPNRRCTYDICKWNVAPLLYSFQSLYDALIQIWYGSISLFILFSTLYFKSNQTTKICKLFLVHSLHQNSVDS